MMRYFADSRDVRRGQPCNPEQYANLQEETMRRIVPGAGVTKSQFGENLMINSTATGGGRGGAIIKIGAFASLNADGNTMEVNMWNGTDWDATTSTIYKPMKFQEQMWNGLTLPDAIGVERTYDVTDLDIRYQRRATWTVDEVEYTEVQEITSLYEVGEWLYIIYDVCGNIVDCNNAGRHWAANERLI
jgi:hypothetical protein